MPVSERAQNVEGSLREAPGRGLDELSPADFSLTKRTGEYLIDTAMDLGNERYERDHARKLALSGEGNGIAGFHR